MRVDISKSHNRKRIEKNNSKEDKICDVFAVDWNEDTLEVDLQYIQLVVFNLISDLIGSLSALFDHLIQCVLTLNCYQILSFCSMVATSLYR